jgi:hypothetical protein
MLLDFEYKGTVFSLLRFPYNITNQMERAIELECEPTKLQAVLYLKVHTHFILEDIDSGEVFYVLKSASDYTIQTDGTLTAEELYPIVEHAQECLRSEFNKQIPQEQVALWDLPIFPIDAMREDLETIAHAFSNA